MSLVGPLILAFGAGLAVGTMLASEKWKGATRRPGSRLFYRGRVYKVEEVDCD